MAILHRLSEYLLLPDEVTSFEDRYRRALNRITAVVLLLHVPAIIAIAWWTGTSVSFAFGAASFVACGTLVAQALLADRPRTLGLVHVMTSIVMGSLLVGVAPEPTRSDLQPYFIAMFGVHTIFASPMILLAAIAGVIAHHIFLWHPVHEATRTAQITFLVISSGVAVFIARTFFNNVIRLERTVIRRTADLNVRNRAMARILDFVDQGLATISLDGTIAPETSRQLTRWFGVPESGTRLAKYLAGKDADLEAWIDLAFTSIKDDLLPFDVALGQLPAQLARGGRQFRLEYIPIGAPATGLLLVVTDITSELERERIEALQRELLAVTEHAYRDRAGLLAFLRDGEEIVRACAAPDTLPATRRRLHTLKGNAAMFGVASIAAICHELEDRTIEELTPPDCTPLVEAWTAFRHRVERLLGLSEPSHHSDAATRPYLERFATHAQQLAQRLGKPEPRIEIDDHAVRFDPNRLGSLWSALVHCVRNAVDHGIEPAEARIAVGKDPTGRIVLATHSDGRQLVVTIEDDGGGIDWAAVAIRAQERGLPHARRVDLEEALFAEGVSTAEEVTDVSGRGVGMGAVRAACRALGGTIEIASERGRGTTLKCRIPLVPRPRNSSMRIEARVG